MNVSNGDRCTGTEIILIANYITLGSAYTEIALMSNASTEMSGDLYLPINNHINAIINPPTYFHNLYLLLDASKVYHCLRNYIYYSRETINKAIFN